MQETIFKMRMKLWDKALQQLQQNQEYLDGAEIEAINALTNYWRKKKFGDECSADVERMVKNMIDCDKKHSNKLEVVQASKDFRGVAREMYTTDAETFKQFADYMQKTQGGPQLTEEQRRRREERQQAQLREAQQRQAQNQQRRSSTTQQPSAIETLLAQSRNAGQTQQRPGTSNTGSSAMSGQGSVSGGTSRTSGNSGTSSGNGGGNDDKKPWLVRLLLLAAVLAGVYWIWNKFTSDEQPSDVNYEEIVIGHWNGKLQSFPATMTLDSLSGNSVFGRIHVEFRNSIVTHRLEGQLSRQGDKTMARLTDIDATPNHHLNGNYLMTIAANGGEMQGNYINKETGKQSEMQMLKQEEANVEGLGKIPGMQERKKGRKIGNESSSSSNPTSDKGSAKPATSPATTPQTAPEQTPKTEPAAEPQLEPEPKKKGGGFRLEKVDQNQIYQGM